MVLVGDDPSAPRSRMVTESSCCRRCPKPVVAGAGDGAAARVAVAAATTRAAAAATAAAASAAGAAAGVTTALVPALTLDAPEIAAGIAMAAATVGCRPRSAAALHRATGAAAAVAMAAGGPTAFGVATAAMPGVAHAAAAAAAATAAWAAAMAVVAAAVVAAVAVTVVEGIAAEGSAAESGAVQGGVIKGGVIEGGVIEGGAVEGAEAAVKAEAPEALDMASAPYVSMSLASFSRWKRATVWPADSRSASSESAVKDFRSLTDPTPMPMTASTRRNNPAPMSTSLTARMPGGRSEVGGWWKVALLKAAAPLKRSAKVDAASSSPLRLRLRCPAAALTSAPTLMPSTLQPCALPSGLSVPVQ